MANAKPKAAALVAPTAWEANCHFCGAGISDEGLGFLDHIALQQGCHDLYDSWVENLSGDWGGGD